MPTPVKRRYDSPRRLAQARATRQAVLEAASALFIESGYAATSVVAIAARAGVSAETVYARFKNKRALLGEVLDVAIVGDDQAIPLMERPWVRRMRAEPDATVRLGILARNGRLILERISPIYQVLRGAADADPHLAALLDDYKAGRFRGQQVLLEVLVGDGGLRDGLTPAHGAEILFAIGSPETYGLLVHDRGWSADDFETWYADTLARLLMP